MTEGKRTKAPEADGLRKIRSDNGLRVEDDSVRVEPEEELGLSAPERATAEHADALDPELRQDDESAPDVSRVRRDRGEAA